MDKKIILWIAIVGILLIGSFLIVKNKGDLSGNVISEENIKNLYKVNLDIKNMYCEACAYGVKAQIQELNGVVSANIDYREANGVVIYDADKVDAQTIADASTVYPATVVNDEKITT